MITELEAAVKWQAKKAVRTVNLKQYLRTNRSARYRKRTGEDHKPPRWKPKTWTLSNQFNPFLVRNKSQTYAMCVSKSIESKTYCPKPCLNSEIPKPGGKKRIVSQYTVVDAAVSNWIYKRLLSKNEIKFSDQAYAFRKERNATMAAEYLSSHLRGRDRIFCVEYDFKNFFDLVDHKYLLRVLADKFDVDEVEMSVVEALLKGQYANGCDNYSKGIFKPRTTGIPQGCSLSLFLANVVFHELDQAIDKSVTAYARFADDIVILCETYDQACVAASKIFEFAKKSGIQINHEKSEGINLIAKHCKEFRAKEHVDFLGYSLSASGIRLSKKRKIAIKRSLSMIVFENLLMYLKRGKINPKRFFSGTDWDLVVCVNKLRNRIYGRGVYEEGLLEEITRATSSPKSIVSNHALVNTVADFVELDGWLVGCINRAMHQRKALLAKMKGTVRKKSLNTSRQSITTGDWYTVTSLRQDTRLPSLVRSWTYARKFLNKRGSRRIRGSYDYD